MRLNRIKQGNMPPSPKDPRPVYVEDINKLVGDINKVIEEFNVALYTKEDKVAGAAAIVESANLIPTKAYTEVTYATDQTFTITAVSTDIDGENIIVTFVNPLDVSQSLSVTYDSESNLVTITHSTSAGTELTITNIDGTGTEATATCVEHGLSDGDYVKITGTTSYDGVYEVLAPTLDTFTFLSAIDTLAESGTGYTIEINTAAGSLSTLINEDVTVGAVVQSAMEGAGIIDYTGTVQLGDYEYGRICKVGELFSDSTNLYIALTATDGVTNETTDFKKIVLAII